MKLLHVTPSFYPAHNYGGPIIAFYHLCQSLAELGCDVRVLTTDAHGTDTVIDVEKEREVEIAERLHVRYCKRRMRHSVSPTLVRLLPHYIQWADVVHLTAVYNFPTIPTLIACRIFRKPVVWSPHGVLQRWAGSRRTKAKAVWEWVCRVVAPNTLMLHTTSEQEAQESRERFPNVEVAVIPYCIQIPEQATHVDGSGVLRLLYLGRLDPKKGIENLLAACKLLKERATLSWSLTIAGVGEARYTESLQAKIRELGFAGHGDVHPHAPLSHQSATGREKACSGTVQMVGQVLGEAKEHLFENADIMVVPSYTENFGVVVAEALVRGVPVIASTGTPWRRLEEMGCGFWVHNDPESVAKAIERMSRLSLRELGRRGREWAKQEFRCDMKAQDMIECYERTCERAELRRVSHAV